MNILLLGEYSSFHTYLKKGLERLGHNVLLVANGDGWKQLKSDQFLYKTSNKIPALGKLQGVISSFYFARKFKSYDVVQFINTFTYPHTIADPIVRMIKKNNNILSLVAAGEDLALYKAWSSGKFKYYFYDEYDSNLVKRKFIGRNRYGVDLGKTEEDIVSQMDIIIPTLYGYGLGYKGNPRLYREVINMPVDLSSVNYLPNCVHGRIVIFHGLNREIDKGTKYIREAMERIQKKYPDKVEIVIDGHLPFDEYVKLLQRTNVVIDQCYGYGYGINALISMAQGKVVLTGARDETLEAYHISREECPIFCAEPNADQIEAQLDYIVQHADRIPEWGAKSRAYVEKYDDCVKVAQRYVDAWYSTGKLG